MAQSAEWQKLVADMIPPCKSIVILSQHSRHSKYTFSYGRKWSARIGIRTACQEKGVFNCSPRKDSKRFTTQVGHLFFLALFTKTVQVQIQSDEQAICPIMVAFY